MATRKPKGPTRKITFLDDVEVLDHNNEVEFKARKGEVKELSVASANRWIKRQIAVEGTVKKTPAPRKPASDKTSDDTEKTGDADGKSSTEKTGAASK